MSRAAAHFLQSPNSQLFQDAVMVVVVGRGSMVGAAIGTLDLAA